MNQMRINQRYTEAVYSLNRIRPDSWILGYARISKNPWIPKHLKLGTHTKCNFIYFYFDPKTVKKKRDRPCGHDHGSSDKNSIFSPSVYIFRKSCLFTNKLYRTETFLCQNFWINCTYYPGDSFSFCSNFSEYVFFKVGSKRFMCKN